MMSFYNLFTSFILTYFYINKDEINNIRFNSIGKLPVGIFILLLISAVLAEIFIIAEYKGIELPMFGINKNIEVKKCLESESSKQIEQGNFAKNNNIDFAKVNSFFSKFDLVGVNNLRAIRVILDNAQTHNVLIRNITLNKLKDFNGFYQIPLKLYTKSGLSELIKLLTSLKSADILVSLSSIKIASNKKNTYELDSEIDLSVVSVDS